LYGAENLISGARGKPILHGGKKDGFGMIQVETTVLINKASERVFALISNFENNPLWQSGTVEARFTSEPPLRIGSVYEQTAKFLGRKVISTFEVIAFEPDHMIKATSTSGSFPITFTRSVQATKDGTRVSAVIEGDSSGFFKLAEPILQRLVQSSVDRDYAKLKRVLEIEGGPEG
jgi:uncharacterized membrane protein